MTIHEKPLDWYVDRLASGERFSFPGFSDSEWFCMTGQRINTRSGFGQLHTEEIGRKLRLAIKAHAQDPTYLRAVPKCLAMTPGLQELDGFLAKEGIPDGFYERDSILDERAAVPGGLKPLIEQLRKMPVVYVGNATHRGLQFLNPIAFFEVTSPDFHCVRGGIDRVVRQLQAFDAPKGTAYLFSCGMSDAVMIARLHGSLPGFLIDVGSIFDAFIGQGGQREWRAKLYKDPKAWLAWVQSNL